MSKEVSILVEYPSPETVIMQYTGLSEVTGMEPPEQMTESRPTEVWSNISPKSKRMVRMQKSKCLMDFHMDLDLVLEQSQKGGLTVLSHSGKKIVSNESRWIKCRQGR